MFFRTMLILVGLTTGIAGMTVNAQGDSPDAPPMTVNLWLEVDPEVVEGDTSADGTLLLEVDEDTLLAVVGGADVVYTRDTGDVYVGTPLIDLGIDSEATLTFVDEDTVETTAVTRTGTLTLESSRTLARSELSAQVWIESERDLEEYSMFAECMGRTAVSPPGAFARPDAILPVRVDDDAGELLLGNVLLTGGGGAYERVTESPFGTFTQVITQTATVSDSQIMLTYYAVADERDDCEVRYTSVFIPFDGDFDALFARADELAAE